MMKDLTVMLGEQLRAYINSADFQKLRKDNPLIAEQYTRLKAADLEVDMESAPKVVRGVIVGNATATSEKNAADITRTVNVDFTSREYLFLVADSNLPKAMRTHIARSDINTNPYHELDIPDSKRTASWAKDAGREACEREQDKFNFKIATFGYELKSYHVEFTEEPMTLKMYPIYANLKDGEGNSHRTVVGVYCPEDGGATIGNYLEGQPIYGKTSKKAKTKKGIKIALIVAGVVIAVAAVVAYFVIGVI